MYKELNSRRTLIQRTTTEAPHGEYVLHRRGIDCTLRVLQTLIWALSRAPQEDPCLLLTKTYMEVGYARKCQLVSTPEIPACGKCRIRLPHGWLAI